VDTMNQAASAATPPSPASESTTPPTTKATAGGIGGRSKPGTSFLSQSSDAQLVTISGGIIDSMTDNAAYPAPFPKLDEVIAARDAYVTLVNAYGRDQASLDARKQARGVLVQLLRDLALYVLHASKGDRAVLIASGFPVQKQRAASGQLAPPQNVRLRRTRLSGSLLALCTAVRSARAYQWRWAVAATPTAWTQAEPSTTSRFTVDGLVPGTTYIAQVRVIGTRGPSDWSDSATMMAV
jgi:hypothetical protein